jgi:hypothetical protein
MYQIDVNDPADLYRTISAPPIARRARHRLLATYTHHTLAYQSANPSKTLEKTYIHAQNTASHSNSTTHYDCPAQPPQADTGSGYSQTRPSRFAASCHPATTGTRRPTCGNCRRSSTCPCRRTRAGARRTASCATRRARGRGRSRSIRRRGEGSRRGLRG